MSSNTPTILDIQEIIKLLPHRYPFLLIDRVIEFNEGESIVAIKNVTVNEPFFQGHFPGEPVMPGVLILEALAQAAGVLAYKSTNSTYLDGTLYLFAGIDNARFRRVVKPGDQLRLEAKLLMTKRGIWKLDTKAYVDGDLACSAELLSARRG
jgi:3-hydroxyacyl-[acyl-carrier-protein] dehydratase